MASTLQNLFTLSFVVTSMLSMGLSLTVSQILQPLRNTRSGFDAVFTRNGYRLPEPPIKQAA